MSVLAELSIFPIDKGISLSPFVRRAVKIVEQSGLDYKLGAMGTTIEGNWPEVMQVIDKCFHALSQDCDRIYLTLKVDYHKDKTGMLKHKVESVQF